MRIGAGGTLGAALLLGAALGASPVAAQPTSGGTWTDPPARSAVPGTPPAAPARATERVGDAKPGAGPAGDRQAIEAKAIESKTVESKTARTANSRSETIQGKDAPSRTTQTRAARTEPSSSVMPTARHAARTEPRVLREVRRVRPPVMAEAPKRSRIVPERVVEQAQVMRPTPRRVVARPAVSRFVEARRDPFADQGPMPARRFEGTPYGERPAFAYGDDRTQRIAAAQAAGYLVVRARSVQFPDGRTLRTYRPYEGDDDLD